MRFQILATDYDGTLAHHGRVDEQTLAALQQLLATGRRLVMVTGRELPELMEVFPHTELFEWIVAENGALLYKPATKEEKLLGEPPPERFVNELAARGVSPISVGRSIVATWEPNEKVVLEVIRDLGLERQVIFNKGAVMVLPAGINKAIGLTAALSELGLSPHNAAGVGDAENDHAFLHLCELSVAVANALPAVKETADFVTKGDHGAGVAQLVEHMVANDLADVAGNLPRRQLKFGAADGVEVTLPAHGPTILVCGPSASGKSTLVTRIIESLAEQQYQFFLVDPEGDYENLEFAVVIGGPVNVPAESEVRQLLAAPQTNVVVNLTGTPISERPPLFLTLLGPVTQMRTATGRPHWLVLDEAHHLLPAEWQPPAGIMPEQMNNLVLITVHPELLSPAMAARVDTLMAVGETAAETIGNFCKATGRSMPTLEERDLEPGEVLLWRVQDASPLRVRIHPPKTERRRHRRKYAEGELPPERSFYFRGPEGKLNLRAQNLTVFLQLADGVDDETWEFHRRRGDYSRWFRECIKDDELAAAAQQIEAMDGVSPQESRELIRQSLQRDYIVLPSGPLPVPEAS